MKLVITFTGYKQIRLELRSGRKVLEGVDFSFDNDLDTMLIAAIDKILKRNRITLLSLKEVSVSGDVDKNSLTYTIVKAWTTAFKTIKKRPELGVFQW